MYRIMKFLRKTHSVQHDTQPHFVWIVEVRTIYSINTIASSTTKIPSK